MRCLTTLFTLTDESCQCVLTRQDSEGWSGPVKFNLAPVYTAKLIMTNRVYHSQPEIAILLDAISLK